MLLRSGNDVESHWETDNLVLVFRGGMFLIFVKHILKFLHKVCIFKLWTLFIYILNVPLRLSH